MSVLSFLRRCGTLFAVLLLVMAACGGEDDGGGAADQAPPSTETPEPDEAEPAGTETTEPPAAEPTETPDTAATADMADPAATAGTTGAAAGGDATVAVASTELGDVLVDADGMTLYLFTPDEQGPSTCYDGCAEAWPPLIVEGDVTVGEGLDQATFGTVARDDGAMQATADGWPLYYFAADSAAGDVTGQGVNDVWFAVTPAGEAVAMADNGSLTYASVVADY